MVDLEIFDLSEPDLLDCIRFCFMSILQRTYRHCRWMALPSSRPDVMYFLPHLYGTVYHMISIDTAETNEFIDFICTLPYDFSDKFREFPETAMNENNMEMADDAASAFK